MTLTVFLIIWYIGVIVAWHQVRYWFKDCEFKFPMDYAVLAVISLLSWGVYVIYFIEWIRKRINIK